MAVQHLRNDHLVAIEPLRLTTLDRQVRGVRHQRLQGFHRVPVIHVREQPSRCVLPRLFSQVARNGLRKRGNFLIELVKLIGQRLDGEGECAAVHGVNGVNRDKGNEDQGLASYGEPQPWNGSLPCFGRKTQKPAEAGF